MSGFKLDDNLIQKREPKMPGRNATISFNGLWGLKELNPGKKERRGGGPIKKHWRDPHEATPEKRRHFSI